LKQLDGKTGEKARKNPKTSKKGGAKPDQDQQTFAQ